METLGESTLQTVLAFTALRMEISWHRARIDSGIYNRKNEIDDINVIEKTVEEMQLLH